MKKTIIIHFLLIWTVIPLFAQEDMQYMEIDTTLVFNKDWFNLQGQYREVKGQKWLVNKVCREGAVGYLPITDSTFPAPNLPCFKVMIPLPEGYEWDDMEVTCNGMNLFSAGYRLSPGYFMAFDEPQERKDSMFVAMQTYQYEYACYPEQQARLMGVGIDRVDQHLNPISYAAQIMVTPFRYETAQEVILFYPQVRLSIRLKEGKNEVPSSVSAPPFNSKLSSFNWYDLAGRRLAAPQKKGVYIENGKIQVTR